jgi:hypothetical protein
MDFSSSRNTSEEMQRELLTQCESLTQRELLTQRSRALPQDVQSRRRAIAVRRDEIKSQIIPQNNEVWPSNDQDIVRYLINKQKFDGLWNLDENILKNLTGKAFSVFQSQNPTIDDQILVSIIVIIMLETRFAGFSSLWHGVVQKARKRIIDLLKKDAINFDELIENIRKQL